MSQIKSQLQFPSRSIPGTGLLIALLALGAGFLGTTAVLGQGLGSDQDADRAAGPATPRTVVASGSTAQYGRWEMTTAKTTTGESCVGIRLLNPPPGSPTLTEGCGSQAVEDQVGTLSGKDGTLYFGRVAADTQRVVIKDASGLRRVASSVRGTDGGRYVVTAVDGNVSAATVTTVDPQGRATGRVDAAAKGSQ